MARHATAAMAFATPRRFGYNAGLNHIAWEIETGHAD
jgi:hypothetical protein